MRVVREARGLGDVYKCEGGLCLGQYSVVEVVEM